MKRDPFESRATLSLQWYVGESVPVTAMHRELEGVRPASYSVHMDAIRGVAAFLVFAGHARMLFFGNHAQKAIRTETASTAISTPPSAMGLGHHAVIVFFVLSGLLVGSSAWKAIRLGRWSWRKYLLQRVTRLWLVLLPALVVGGCLDRIGIKFLSRGHSIYTGPVGQGMVNMHLENVLSAKVLAGNAVFLQTIYVPTFGTNAALSTLTNEFWYYMLFPLIVLLCVGRRPGWTRVVYAVLALCIVKLIGTDIAALFVIWLMGFAVSLLRLSIPPSHQRTFVAACFIQFLAVNIGIRIHALSPLSADALLGLSFSVFLYSLLHLKAPIKNVSYQAIATSLSNYSYTLYLFHLPFVTLLTALAMTPWHPWPEDVTHLVWSSLLVGVTYGYAWLMYWCFERNTQKVRAILSNKLFSFTSNEHSLRQV